MIVARSIPVMCALVAMGTVPVLAQSKPPAPMAAAASGESWVASQGGAVPVGARPAGYEPAGYLYVCRATTDGGVHPGKVRPGFAGCYVPLDGREVSVSQYE